MERTQIYLRTEQRRQIARRAQDEGISQSELIRRILDRTLHFDDDSADRLAAIEATAGILPDAPDWPEWLDNVRGNSTDEALTDH